MSRIGMVALFISLSLFGCSQKEKKAKADQEPERFTVSAHEILGKTPEELEEMQGEPNAYKMELKGHSSGYMTWKDIQGIKVFVAIRGGKSHYVTFTFQEETDFDERKLLSQLGLKYPSTEPRLIPPAKRWQPYEKYDRLTIDPETKMISLGSKSPMGALR